MSETLATYTLQLIGPKDEIPPDWRGNIVRVRSVLNPALLRETEENLTDLLPEGYSVRIKEWDE